METIIDRLKVRPETMLKSMITTNIVILNNLITETEKYRVLSYSDLNKNFKENFKSNLYRVLYSRQLCEIGELEWAAGPLSGYVQEYLDSICENGFPVSYQDIINKHMELIQKKFNIVFSIDRQNMIISNSISVALLSFISFLIDTYSKETADLITKAVIGRMGQYSASSLESFIVEPEDTDLNKILKVMLWVFINGNPDMKIMLEEVNDNKFIIVQTGICRQYVNSEILEIDTSIVWPVNLESFVEIVRYFSKDIKIKFDRKQCMGDSVCRMICWKE